MTFVPGWSAISRIAESRAVRTSYVWFILVPILAKVFGSVERIVQFEVLGAPLTLTMDLPFNWVLLFFAALSFAIGTAAYSLRVPSFIALFPTGTEFFAGEREKYDLMDHARRILCLMDGPENTDKLVMEGDLHALQPRQRGFIQELCSCTGEATQYSDHLAWPKMLELPIRERSAFWVAHRHADAARPKSRQAVFAFYLGGGVFIGWMTALNVLYAIRFIFQ